MDVLDRNADDFVNEQSAWFAGYAKGQSDYDLMVNSGWETIAVLPPYTDDRLKTIYQDGYAEAIQDCTLFNEEQAASN